MALTHDQLWKHTSFAERVAEIPRRGGLIALNGVSAAQLQREFPTLARHLAELNVTTLLIDPRSVHQDETSLHGLSNQLISALERHGLTNEAVFAAASNYEASRRTPAHLSDTAQGRIRHELLGELLITASAVMPFAVLVLHGAEFGPGDRQGLEFLAKNVFADPIARLSPELASEHAIRAALVFVQDDFPSLNAEVFDFHQLATDAFRAFLAEGDVVQQLVDATHGDVARLADLVSHLPQNALNLQWVRYTNLEPNPRALLQVLSVANEPLRSELAQRALALLQSSEFFARSVKQAMEAGLLRRNISGGQIQLWVDDDQLPSMVRQSLSDESRASIHVALANAERLNDDEVNVAFVARHFLAGGKAEEGLDFLEHAVKRLAARGSWEEAVDLFERGRPFVQTWPLPLRLLRVDVLAAMGRYRDALLEADGITVEPADQPAFHVRIGQLLVRVSEFEDARAHFEKALQTNADSAARLGIAECEYALGNLERAGESLHQLVADLLTQESPEAQRHLIVGQNLLGRIAIFRADYDRATELFETNRTVALRYAWEDEIARADANLGVVAMQRRNHTEAIRRLNDALVSNGLRGARPRAYGLVNLATVYQRLEEYSRALESCLEALRCARRADDDVAYGVAAHNLATIYQDLGAFDRGHTIIDHLHTGTEKRTVVGRWSRLVSGYLLFDEHRYLDAMPIFEELSSGQDGLLYQPEARIRLAQVHAAIGQAHQANRLLDALNIDENTGDGPLLAALKLLTRAQMDLADNPGQALDQARDAHARLKGLSQRTDTLRAALTISDALIALERPVEARAILETHLHDILRRATHVPDTFQASYFGKPDHRDLVTRLQALRGEVPEHVSRAIHTAMPAENSPAAPVRHADWTARYPNIVGESPRLYQVFKLLDRVARSSAPVLVYGESGTGKELVAEAIHANSQRANAPFIKVNCAAFVDNLLLSELFGHEKGAFTGATSQKQGRFELAHGGTIFLDEIGDISPNTQVALLRVLQEGTFERVGGTQTLNVDVRVVCATNRNLEEMVQRGEFRLDLYYRLKGVVIDTPALRERRLDIPRLVQHFASKYADVRPKSFAPDVLKHLARYSWPGNIRELQNFVRSILLFVEGDQITMDDVSDFADFFISGRFDDVDIELDHAQTTPTPVPRIAPAAEKSAESEMHSDPEEVLVQRIVKDGMCLNELKKRLEVEAIKRALLEADGNVTKAAEILQMKRPRLSQIINSTDELADLKANLVG